MRAFYVDEEEARQAKTRTYYVKIINVSLPDHLIGYKAIEAETTQELLTKIREVFEFPNGVTFQLWSSSTGNGVRLDELPIIPKDYEFLSVRVQIKNMNEI
jgi:hypothetical protein